MFSGSPWGFLEVQSVVFSGSPWGFLEVQFVVLCSVAPHGIFWRSSVLCSGPVSCVQDLEVQCVSSGPVCCVQDLGGPLYVRLPPEFVI